MEQFHGTTILCVRRNGVAAMAGDGQATLGNIVGGGLFVGGLYWYLNRK